MTVQEYKAYKGLKKESLRDNMTDIELVLNMLAEVTTTAISQKEKPSTMPEHKQVARSGALSQRMPALISKSASNEKQSPLSMQKIKNF